MSRYFFLVLVVLLLLPAAPAWSRLSLGLLQESAAVTGDERRLQSFAGYLGQVLGEEVRLRLFREQEVLHEWLYRFREVDLALLGHDYLQMLPGGQVTPVADFIPARAAGEAAPLRFVARQGLAPRTVKRLQDALLEMDRDPAGREVLRKLGVRRFVPSGSVPVGRTRLAEAPPKLPAPVAPERPQPEVRTQPAPEPEPKSEPEPKPKPKSQLEPEPSLEPRSESPPPEPQPEPEPEISPAPVAPEEERPTVSAPQEREAPLAAPPERGEDLAQEPRIWLDEKPAPTAVPAPPEREKPGVKGKETAPTPEAEDAAGGSGPVEVVESIPVWKKLLDTVILIAAFSLAGWFLMRRRRRLAEYVRKQKHEDQRDTDDYITVDALVEDPLSRPLQAPPAPSPSARKSARPAAAAKPQKPADEPAVSAASPAREGQSAVINKKPVEPSSAAAGALQRGRLDLEKVRSLLQQMDSYAQPATLVIRSPHDEKRLHFRQGRIASAASINRANRNQAGFLMNKLGYLLIRMGHISEDERDRALEVSAEFPEKRLGEILVDSGALSRPDLQKALQTQAEGIVFSLFLFPQGEFELLHEEQNIAVEDNLALEVDTLLSEAARHEEEWSGLRRQIPSLETVLDYDAQGREKLGQARMTVHQKLILSLIDGQRTIKDICVESTMLDFEIYKFLHLMVRANILRGAAD